MLKTFSIALLVALSCTSISAQTDEQYRTLLADAQKCATATLKQDVLSLRKYTHPNVIQATGGPEAFITVVTEAFKQMTADGMVIDTAYAELPSSKIIEEQGELRCLVPNTMAFTIGESKIVSYSSLMGFSFDKGKSWCFVEAEKLKDETTRKSFFPKYKSDIFIPDDRVEMTED
jgi:hypothetical protein